MLTIAERKGPKPFQEDRNFYASIAQDNEKMLFLAVMDGHNGSEAVDICVAAIEKKSKHFSIYAGTAEIRNIIRELNTLTKGLNSGSTLSTVLVAENPLRAHVGVIGDSPVVIYCGDGSLIMSPVHNVRVNIGERMMAEDRGGVYMSDGYISSPCGRYGTQLSRALGDWDMGVFVLREPEVYTVSDPQWILVASDGLLDPTHEDIDTLLGEVKKFAESNATADDLMEWAGARRLRDNATAIVWSATDKILIS